MQYVRCTIYVQHIHFYTHSVYNEVIIPSITHYQYVHCTMYRLYRIQYTYVVCEECSVFAIHYKYIVEGLRKTIRRAKIIDHSF